VANLTIQGLHKRFGDVVAVDSVDLTVESGELVSVLGPSGCGKTTVLRILAGFEYADGGSVAVDGELIDAVPANKRNMGMVFQAYSLFPTMTARQNVEFGLRVRGTAKAVRAAKAAEVLALVGLHSHGDRYAHQLSGGEQQRVALARALALEPRVLLLDEPLSALDAKVRGQLRGEIRLIQSRLGITTIYVTHDQEEAFSISDRVVIMSAGHVQQVGAPAEIYRNPENLFVAEFVGTVNRLDGTMTSSTSVAVGPNGTQLDVATEGRSTGQAVAVLVRPESIRALPADAAGPEGGDLSGRVKTHTFLGPVTRVAFETDVGVILADMPSGQALTLDVGAPVVLQIDASGVQLMSL
jgi:putative spermidine/putrescine transport system ATP-binding protein